MAPRKKKNAADKTKADTPVDGAENTEDTTQDSTQATTQAIDQNQQPADPIQTAEIGKETNMEDNPGIPEHDAIKQAQEPETLATSPIKPALNTLGPAASGTQPSKPGVEGMLVELLLASQDVIQGYQTLDKGKSLFMKIKLSRERESSRTESPRYSQILTLPHF